jgi:hypothetical protein
MAIETEEGTVKITVVDDTAAGLAQVQQSVASTNAKLQGSTAALADTTAKSVDKAGDGMKRMQDAADKTTAATKKTREEHGRLGLELAKIASSTKDIGDKAKDLIGKLGSVAGAYGPLIAAGGILLVQTVEWAAAQRNVADAAEERAKVLAQREEEEIARLKEINALVAQQQIDFQRAADLKSERRDDEATALEREAEKQAALGASLAHVNDLRIQGLEIRKKRAIDDALVGKSDEDEIARIQHQIEMLQIQGDLSQHVLDAAPTHKKIRKERIEDLDKEAELLAEISKAITQAAMAADKRRRDELAAEDKRGADLAAQQLARDEHQIQAAAALRMANARSEREQIEITAETETKLHALRLRQLAEEHAARMNALNAREADIRAQTPEAGTVEALQKEDAIKQVLHDKEIARQQHDLEVARAKDAEEARLAESARARRQQQLADAEMGISAFEQLHSQVADLTTSILEFHAGKDEEATARTVKALEARGRAQQAAISRELKAAEGNVALQNEIRRKGARQETELQARIEKANADHKEKIKRQETKAAGIKLIIDGAVNAAKAVSAFASYNFVQGALYTAAAAFNFAQGGMLIAGNVPQGGGAAGNAGGAGSGAFDRETSEAAKTPGSTPSGEAARRSTAATAQADRGGASGTIIIYGGVHANGAIDEDFAENVARKLRDVSKSREAA